MPNDIPTRQNEPRFTDFVAASSQSYDNSARYSKWQTSIVIATAVVVPAINAFYPAFQAWGALVGGLVVLVDFILFERSVKYYQELGAKIQEVFDTELLGIPWNAIRVGERPLPETIVGLSDQFKKARAKDSDSITRLQNWYPVVAGKLPLELGRLVCQRSSMVWDANMRKRYCRLYIVVIFLMVIAGTGYALLREWTLAQFLLGVVAPLLPAIVKVWRGYSKHQESAGASERARQSLSATWTQAMTRDASADVLLTDSRHLQDELFDRRKTSSRVPNWFYRSYRPEFERQMTRGAEEMVMEAHNLPNAGQ